ncbi:metallophosphoesterase [Actinoplanes sp. TRM 88003]|uniref:Metallophosphoesterase n=1 Tax=Paractinoplanes aksuensis TaxID=2939490 RepID=A0ABT1DV34_9ACTN|nr:metallophosphoesterase [Actinoplanes aksuensis]MCO8274665.1 metallophosphoesterase [Actinoplanes aksuensis]
MRLLDDRPRRLATISYQAAARGGGTESVQLGVDRLLVDSLPDGCRAVLAAGDLQGVAPSPLGGRSGLLGIAVADYLEVWAEDGLLPSPDQVGVLLAGDLYSAPEADRRGASGPVTDVWLAFVAAGCPAIFGVAGNHDEVTASEVAALGPDVALLDGDRREFNGLTVAGVSGVIGDPARPLRRADHDFHAAVEAVIDPSPDVLLLHEGPAGEDVDQRGNGSLRALIERRAPALTICGHVHWARPTALLGSGHIINVDTRVVVLVAAS